MCGCYLRRWHLRARFSRAHGAAVLVWVGLVVRNLHDLGAALLGIILRQRPKYDLQVTDGGQQ